MDISCLMATIAFLVILVHLETQGGFSLVIIVKTWPETTVLELLPVRRNISFIFFNLEAIASVFQCLRCKLSSLNYFDEWAFCSSIISQRLTPYCVIEYLNMLNIWPCMKVSSWFSSNSEALASELLENLEEMFSHYKCPCGCFYSNCPSENG